MKEEYKDKYKFAPFYIEASKLSSEDTIELLDFCVDCGAIANDCIIESNIIAEESYENFFEYTNERGLYQYIGVSFLSTTWVSNSTKACYGLHSIELKSLEEVKELFEKTYQGSLPKEKEGLAAEHKGITQYTSIVNTIVVGNNIYEKGRLYFNEHDEIVLLIGNIHNCFVVHHPTTNQVLPNCKNLYEIKSELGKVTTSVELIDNVFYKVTYGSGLTKVLSYIADYGFISEYDGSNYQDLYKDFKVICKMTEA